MRAWLLCSFMSLVIVGCVPLHVPTRKLGFIAPGSHDQVAFRVDLPKSSWSWEIGFWPGSTSSNLSGLLGQHIVARLSNVSDQSLTLSPGIRSPVDRMLVIPPEGDALVFDGVVQSLAQATCLFGCDTSERKASFLLSLDFQPPLHTSAGVTVVARGRDAE